MVATDWWLQIQPTTGADGLARVTKSIRSARFLRMFRLIRLSKMSKARRLLTSEKPPSCVVCLQERVPAKGHRCVLETYSSRALCLQVSHLLREQISTEAGMIYFGIILDAWQNWAKTEKRRATNERVNPRQIWQPRILGGFVAIIHFRATLVV